MFNPSTVYEFVVNTAIRQGDFIKASAAYTLLANARNTEARIRAEHRGI